MAVQYDPGHAELPWALVRFLLKVLSSHPPAAKGTEIDSHRYPYKMSNSMPCSPRV